MNFFKLYIGDYQRDTGHLSVAEHGVYMLMLQHYYATEKPLPTGRNLYRLLRATDRSERRAIDSIVNQFWIEAEGGLINVRASEELIKGAEISETNRNIALEREAKKRAGKEVKKEHEPCSKRGTDRGTNTPPSEHLQTPDSRLQDSSLRSESKIPTPNGVVLQASPTTPLKRSWIDQAKDVLDFLSWKTGKAYRAINPKGKSTKNADFVIGRLAEGYSVDDCKAVALLKIGEWFDDDKMRLYLRPKTLYCHGNFDTYLGETKRLPEEELRRIRIANGFQPASFQANGNGGSGHAH